MKHALLFLSVIILALFAKAQPIPLPNGGFENWNVTSDTPASWHIHEYGEVLRTTDKHSGTYAIKLVSKYDSLGNVRWASITLGSNSSQLGMPFTRLKDTLIGYYKYISNGSDAGSIDFGVYKNGWSVTSAPATNFKFTPTANFTYFEIPIAATDTPDQFIVEFFSSDINGGPFIDGSSLFLDDLQFKNTPTDIDDIINREKMVVVYPSPTTNALYISPKSNTKEVLEVSIYNVIGKLVYSHNFKQNLLNTFSVSVGGFEAGLYQYRVIIGDVTTTGKFIKE